MTSLPSSVSDVSLSTNILNGLASVLQEAEDKNQPLEIEPARGQLFALFVTAHGAGYLDEGAEVDMTADALCREFAERWGLDAAARQSFQQQEKLDPSQVAKLRLIWSLMRMWMEWTYAWQRWPEFQGTGPESQTDNASDESQP